MSCVCISIFPTGCSTVCVCYPNNELNKAKAEQWFVEAAVCRYISSGDGGWNSYRHLYLWCTLTDGCLC